MSCAGKGYGTKPSSNAYLFSPFYGAMTNTVTPTSTRACRKATSTYPNFTPHLYTLSTTSTTQGTYTPVSLQASTMFPFGTTYVSMQSKTNSTVSFNLPLTYFSSLNGTFVIPENAPKDVYLIRLINIYNTAFGSTKWMTQPGRRVISPESIEVEVL